MVSLSLSLSLLHKHNRLDISPNSEETKEMKRFVAGSLVSGLISCGGGSYMSAAEMMARPGSMQGVMMNKQQSQQYYYWSRMMSSGVEKSEEVVNGGGVEAIKEEEKKKNGDEEKGTVNSYWGVSRPSIKRPDGTDWPWNCFMVIITFLSFSLGDSMDLCVLVNEFFCE